MTCLVRPPVVRIIALILLSHWCCTATAVGLGAIRVQSSLGQRLAAEIPIIGTDSAELTSACIRARLQSADGAVIGSATAAVSHASRGDAIVLSTRQAINEPAILVEVNIVCGSMVHRDFSILLDPAGSMPVVSDLAARLPTETEMLPRGAESSRQQRRRERATRTSNGPNTTAASRDEDSAPAPRRDVPAEAAFPARPLNTTLMSSRRDAPKSALPSKNVLKLSSEGFTAAELASMGHLKMSSGISDSAPPMNAAQREGVIAARNLFAQMMRSEGSAASAQTEYSANLRQVKTLENQITVINRQSATDRAALENLKKNSLSLNWVFVLVGLLLLCVIGIAWLAWRLMMAKDQTASSWAVGLANHEAQQVGTGRAAGGLANAGSVTSAAKKAVVSAAIIGTKPSMIAPRKSSVSPTKSAQKMPQVGTDFGHNPSAAISAATPRTQVVEVPMLPEENDPLGLPLAFPAAKPGEAAPVNSIDRQEAMHFYSSRVEHLKVEEISDVMQEAEFWMSLNDPQRAIEILEPYAALDLPDSPMPWLYLLDLYRGIGEQAKYTLLQEKAVRLFNVRIASWNEDASAIDGRTLEDFPHVIAQICTLWETSDIFPYLEELVFDRREGVRTGFDLSVYQEIMLLLTIARSYVDERPEDVFKSAEKNRMAI